MLRSLSSFFALTLLFSVVSDAQITGGRAADAITRLNMPRDGSIVGNSVDAGTGSFSMEATVLTLNGGRVLDFTLLYDSIGPPASIVGRPRSLGGGWTHAYSARLTGNPATLVTVWWDDNRRNSFSFDGSGYVALDEAARYDRVTRQADGSWRVMRRDGSEYRFDAEGRLTQLANKIRQRIEVEYDGSDRISALIEPISDKEIGFRYTDASSRRIAHLTDPAGRETHFLYDSSARLRALHNPTGFDVPVGPAFVPMPIPDSDPNGLVYEINVVRSRRMGLLKIPIFSVGHENPSEVTVTLISPEGTSVEIQDLLSRPSANALSASDLILQEYEGENPRGVWRLVLVDRQAGGVGRLNGVSLAFSDRTFPTYLAYDQSRLIKATDAAGERYFENFYDEDGRTSMQDDGRDDTPLSSFRYGTTAAGGVTTTYSDRSGEQWVFEHDARYRLLRFVDPLGGQTSYDYNGKGERVGIRDPLGRTTTFTYDDDGNIASVNDPALNVSRMEYDSQHNMTRFTDAGGNSTTFRYDSEGNVTEVRDALDHRTRKTYGGNGQLIENMMHDDAGVQYTYSDGMVVGARRMDASGSKVERTDYDALGFPTMLADAEGRETKLEYDERLNVIARTNPLGARETKEFDARNRLIRIVDFNGAETSFRYDGNNNLVARTNALGKAAIFLYDPEDREVERMDPQGRSSRGAYDAVGRLVRTIDGLGHESRREYDAGGNIVAVYDAEDRQVRRTVYDERDLPVEVMDAAGNRVRTEYDALGNLTSITNDADETTLLRYDELGRLIEVEDPLGRVFQKEYFSDDVVRAIEDASGARTTFAYDRANRLTRIEPFAGRVAAVEFRYDEAYQLVRDELPGGAKRDYEYDDAGRLTRVSFTGDGSPGDRTLAYDANSNLVRVGESGAAPLERDYDALNRQVGQDDGVVNGSIAQPADAFPGVVAQPAKLGGVVTLFANGLGPTEPPAVTGDRSLDTLRPVTIPVKVTVGGAEAQVLFAGLAPQFVGLYQINIVVPLGAVPGNAVPVVVEQGGLSSRDDVTIALRP